MINEIKCLIYDHLFNRQSASVMQCNITSSCVLKLRKKYEEKHGLIVVFHWNIHFRIIFLV